MTREHTPREQDLRMNLRKNPIMNLSNRGVISFYGTNTYTDPPTVERGTPAMSMLTGGEHQLTARPRDVSCGRR